MTGLSVASAVIDALERLQIPYMFVGSFSTNLYGVPRSTKDADLVIELGQHSPTEIARELGSGYVLNPQISFESVTGTTRYELHHGESDFKVEFFLLSDDPHDQERFRRRVEAPLAGRRAYVATAEDTIITKVRWAHRANRRKDLDDIANVLAVQSGRLDLAYIRSWCDRHGTRELFERLLKEAMAAL